MLLGEDVGHRLVVLFLEIADTAKDCATAEEGDDHEYREEKFRFHVHTIPYVDCFCKEIRRIDYVHLSVTYESPKNGCEKGRVSGSLVLMVFARKISVYPSTV